MPKITVNNTTLYYETFGSGDPVIFITGFSVDHTVWSQTAPHFAKHYQTILIDNRGCGQSDSPDMPYTVEMMAEDIAALCKTLQLKHCHLIGSSMGGAIAQALAYRYPELVRSAVLCNTFTKIDIRFALYAEARLEFFAKNISLSSTVKSSLGWAFSSEFLNQPGMVDAFIEMAKINPYPFTEVGYRNQLHALLNFDSAPWIRQIKVPCLVVGSDQDMIVSEAHMRQLAQYIPNARYQHFTGASHLPHIEQPDLFNKVVYDFLIEY